MNLIDCGCYMTLSLVLLVFISVSVTDLLILTASFSVSLFCDSVSVPEHVALNCMSYLYPRFLCLAAV